MTGIVVGLLGMAAVLGGLVGLLRLGTRLADRLQRDDAPAAADDLPPLLAPDQPELLGVDRMQLHREQEEDRAHAPEDIAALDRLEHVLSMQLTMVLERTIRRLELSPADRAWALLGTDEYLRVVMA